MINDGERLAQLARLGDKDAQRTHGRDLKRRNEPRPWKGSTGTLPGWALPFAASHGRELLRLVESLEVADDYLLPWRENGHTECSTIVTLCDNGEIDVDNRWKSSGTPYSDYYNVSSLSLYCGKGNIADASPIADAIRDNVSLVLALFDSWEAVRNHNGNLVGRFNRELREELRMILDRVECPVYHDAGDWLSPVDDLEIAELVNEYPTFAAVAAVYVEQAEADGVILAEEDVERVIEDRFDWIDSELD